MHLTASSKQGIQSVVSSLIGLCVLLISPFVIAQPAVAPLNARDMAMTMTGDFTLASVGDLMIRRPASQLGDAEVQAVFELIREADLAVGNMEGELANLNEFEGPLNGFVGSHLVAADLVRMGFDMVNRAQNHLLDAEFDGMFSTNALLDQAGVVHAGSGKNLQEAAAPAFLETPKGRAAIVGMHTPNFPEHYRLAATPQIGNLGGRPGLNMLNYREAILVSRQQYNALQAVQAEFQRYRDRYDNPRPIPSEPSDAVVSISASSSGRHDPVYRIAQGDQVPGTVVYEMDASDLERILRNIRNARQFADLVIAAAHSHQSRSVMEQQHLSTRPPDFYVELAHQAIDAGADAFVGTGVQLLRGIEIYNDKPVFYGLGEFFREAQWELDVVTGNADANQRRPMQQFARNFGGSAQSLESLVAISHYRDGRLAEVRLYPVELGVNGPDSRLGIPRLAPPQQAREILERVTRLSDQWGTSIDIEGSVGVIRVAIR